MPDRSDPDHAPIPVDSLVFGYGPMLPYAAAALGAWTLPPPWPTLATGLGIVWGGLILAFLAGVRRGYGFGAPHASKPREIAAMLSYFVPAGLALITGWAGRSLIALVVLLAGHAAVAVLDRRAAFAGDAPAHFARLRPPQLAIAILALAALVARLSSAD